MCQCRFMDWNKGTTLVQGADDGMGVLRMHGDRAIGNISIASVQFYYKSEIVLKKKKKINPRQLVMKFSHSDYDGFKKEKKKKVCWKTSPEDS